MIIIINPPLAILHIAIFMTITVYDLAPRRRTVSAPAKAADRAEPTRRGELSGSTPKQIWLSRLSMMIKKYNTHPHISFWEEGYSLRALLNKGKRWCVVSCFLIFWFAMYHQHEMGEEMDFVKIYNDLCPWALPARESQGSLSRSAPGGK